MIPSSSHYLQPSSPSTTSPCAPETFTNALAVPKRIQTLFCDNQHISAYPPDRPLQTSNNTEDYIHREDFGSRAGIITTQFKGLWFIFKSTTCLLHLPSWLLKELLLFSLFSSHSPPFWSAWLFKLCKVFTPLRVFNFIFRENPILKLILQVLDDNFHPGTSLIKHQTWEIKW